MSIKKIFSMVLLFSATTGIMAQEVENANANSQSGAWKIGLGVAYRNFESTKIDLNSRTTHALYENRELGAMYESAYSTTIETGKNADIDFSDSLAPVLTGMYEFWEKDAISLSIVGNLQYFSLDTKSKVNVSNEVNTYYTPILHPEFGSVNGGTATTYAKDSISIDMDLLVLDLGVHGNYAIYDNLSVFLATGSSLNYADFSAKYAHKTYSTDKLIAGVYAEAGLEFVVLKNFSIAGSLRYDWTFSDVETRIAEQELDGIGSVIRATFSF